ncbi:hypothetical protein KKA14_14725 [bacterium]|nr:hypothetical protein [bacterium]
MEETDSNSKSEEVAEQVPKVVITLFPTSPEFFGDNDSFKYPLFPSVKLLQKKTNIDDIKRELNRTKRRAILDPKIRDKLSNLLKKFPGSAELNALDAIKKFLDMQQSSSTDRFSILESIVLTLGRAVNTYPYNINTLSWFLRIYSQYLNQLQLANAKKGHSIGDMSFHNANKQIVALKKLGDKSILEFDSFLSKFQNSSYGAHTIQEEEIKAALRNIVENNPDAEVGKLKIPSSVIQNAYIKINLSLARIPIFSKRVHKNIADFKIIEGPELHLQYDMLETTMLMSDYMFQAYRSDSTDRKNLLFLSSILKKCKGSIDRLKNPEKELGKEYEYDPFIKFSLLTIRISDFDVPAVTKKIYLEKAIEYLDRVNKKCTDPNGIKQASQLLNKINQVQFRFKIEEEEKAKKQTKPS